MEFFQPFGAMTVKCKSGYGLKIHFPTILQNISGNISNVFHMSNPLDRRNTSKILILITKIILLFFGFFNKNNIVILAYRFSF